MSNRYRIDFDVINPSSNAICAEYNSGIFPQTRSDYRVINLGLTDIQAEALYGTIFSWIGTITGKGLKPGEDKILSISSRSYYVTCCKISNSSDSLRALVYVGFTSDFDWAAYMPNREPIDIDWNDIIKRVVTFGVSKIPHVGEYLSEFVDFFWPDNKESTWDQIKNQVSDLIDSKTNEAIRGILGGDMMYMSTRIKGLKEDLDENRPTDTHYMNIAEDLIGFEKKFVQRKTDNPNYIKVNFFILPLYSAIVTMKMKYYQFGIVNQNKLKLDDQEVSSIKAYSRRLLKEAGGAMDYITKLFEDIHLDTYQTCRSDNVFNAMATIRTYIGINGFEFFSLWNAILDNPSDNKKPYSDVVTYSSYFARPTPWQAKHIIPKEMSEPLQPKLINGKRNKIAGIDIWLYAAQKISGLNIYWENGESTSMGKWTAEKDYLELKGAYIKQLTVWGDGALDCLKFVLTDGRTLESGNSEASHDINATFELEDHIICGIALGSDVPGLHGQAANISVSYQLANS